jgi:hypothetical protein
MGLVETPDAPTWADTTNSAPRGVGGVAHGNDHDHDDSEHVHGVDGHVHEEAKAPTAPSRAVMIDIGTTKGALILDSRAEFSGVEVEIHPVHEPSKRTHVWVLPREGRDGLIYNAIFPSLAMGEYAVLSRSGTIAFTVDVAPNTITHASWD